MKQIVWLISFLIFLKMTGNAQMSLSDSVPPVLTFNYKKDYKSLLDSSQDPASVYYYPTLLKRFNDNDSTLSNYEVLALMVGHTISPKYKPLEDLEKENEIFELNLGGKYEEALSKGISFLKSRALNLLVFREVAYAYEQQSKYYSKELQFEKAIQYQDSSKYYMSLNDKIMEAMIFSGKGKSPKEPIFSLGLSDGEYFIFNVGFEIEKKDTEWSKDGLFQLKITAIQGLMPSTYYFVIQHARDTYDEDRAKSIAAEQAKNAAKKKKKKESKKELKQIAKMMVDSTGNSTISVDSLGKQVSPKKEISKSKTGKKKNKGENQEKLGSSLGDSIDSGSISLQQISAEDSSKDDWVNKEKKTKKKSKSSQKEKSSIKENSNSVSVSTAITDSVSPAVNLNTDSSALETKNTQEDILDEKVDSRKKTKPNKKDSSAPRKSKAKKTDQKTATNTNVQSISETDSSSHTTPSTDTTTSKMSVSEVDVQTSIINPDTQNNQSNQIKSNTQAESNSSQKENKETDPAKLETNQPEKTN
jgi:hypothetical protein